jgi:carbon-monoxide dehydrogenase small subunit
VDKVSIALTLNGSEREVWIWPYQMLLHVLREELGATEVKYGCGEGVCSTCAVLVDGRSVNSCLMLAVQARGRDVTTVKGLAQHAGLHPLQESFLRYGASQCGFCTPGMLTIAYEFLAEHPRPTRDEIRYALAGNLCRCTGYTKIVDAIEAFAAAQQETGPASPADGRSG